MSSNIITPDQPVLWGSLADGSPFPMYTPFGKQRQFHESEITKLLAIGSRGSGKSVMLRMDAHMRALSCPGANLVLVRKSYKDLLKNHVYFDATERMPWSSLKQEMELLGGTFHSTNYICHYPNGSRLFLSYVGQELGTLLGAQFLAAYFDEISTIPWEFFTLLAASVRVAKGSGRKAVIRAATNPLGVSTAEVMKYFVNKDVDYEEERDYDPREWGYIQINMEDNPHLDIDQYRKSLSGLGLEEHVKKAWLEGIYSEEDALFSFYPTREGNPWHVIKEVDLPGLAKKARIYRAYDHGYKPDPAYCVWIAHLGNRYIAIHEKVWYETAIPEIAASIKHEEQELGIDHVVETFCDPTIHIKTGQPRTIKELFEDYGIYMEPSINDRRQYAAVLHTALAEEVTIGYEQGPEGEQIPIQVPRLQIYNNGRRGCPYLVKSIPLQRYNPKKPMSMADNKHDHPVVAMSYFLTNFAADERRPLVKRQVKPWMRMRGSEPWVLGQHNTRRRFN